MFESVAGDDSLTRAGSAKVLQGPNDSLLAQWRNFVREVERGYTLTIYDYTNDLSVRDVLENVIKSIRESARSKLREVITPWDERFEKATRKIDRPLLATDAGQTWWFRVPLILVGELKEDMDAQDLS